MKLVFMTAVFMMGVYFGLRAERGGDLELVVETIASFVSEKADRWR